MVSFLKTLYLKNILKKCTKGTKTKNNMEEQDDYLMIYSCLMLMKIAKDKRKEFSGIFRAKRQPKRE